MTRALTILAWTLLTAWTANGQTNSLEFDPSLDPLVAASVEAPQIAVAWSDGVPVLTWPAQTNLSGYILVGQKTNLADRQWGVWELPPDATNSPMYPDFTNFPVMFYRVIFVSHYPTN